MDSLLANYASSDEEEEPQQQQQSTYSPSKPISLSSTSSANASSLFSSLPQPKSSSLFSSLPQPHKNPINKIPIQHNTPDKPSSNSNKSSIFSSLPQPKSQTSQQPEKPTKRIVRFIPPSIKSNNSNDEDDDEDEEEEKQRKKRKESEYLNQDSSVKSFLSSIPAPKSSATLGVLHSNQGSGRRSIIETEAPASSSSDFGAKNESSTLPNEANRARYEVGSGQNVVDYANHYQSLENYANYEMGSGQNVVDYTNHYQSVENYASHDVGSDQNVGNYANFVGYESGIDQNVHSVDGSSYVNYGSYNGYGDYGQYGSGAMVQETAGIAVSGPRMPGKRGKYEVPTDIVEVNQEELMKDRPREDQAKLTGIAFGPSYQPVSTKGKPTKLHKRKHQIGSLFFDMKQKEMELTERRARGFLTKAQTQGKYGW